MHFLRAGPTIKPAGGWRAAKPFALFVKGPRSAIILEMKISALSGSKEVALWESWQSMPLLSRTGSRSDVLGLALDSDMVIELDASTFQRKLETLAEALAQKLRREAPKILGATPGYVSIDLHILLRQMIYTYNLFFYLNADERVESDPHYRKQYSVVILPLIRNMIDCFYNITAILQNPVVKGAEFRSSGYKAKLTALAEDEARYGGQQEWDEWIAKSRTFLKQDMQNNGFKEAEVLEASKWRTLGSYVKARQPGGTFSPHQQALKLLNYGPWREYSALAHGTFDGLLDSAMSYIPDVLPLEERPKLDEVHSIKLATHISQAAGVLISVVTELQAYFRFDDAGARINERIHEVWNALLPTFTVKELYDGRYAELMKDKGINP